MRGAFGFLKSRLGEGLRPPLPASAGHNMQTEAFQWAFPVRRPGEYQLLQRRGTLPHYDISSYMLTVAGATVASQRACNPSEFHELPRLAWRTVKQRTSGGVMRKALGFRIPAQFPPDLECDVPEMCNGSGALANLHVGI